MELKEPIDIYAYHLGTLMGNLHSLEVMLRVALSDGNWQLDLHATVGDQVEASAINQWAYLSGLVKQFNEKVSTTHPQHTLVKGEDIVRLRNALAHGIVIGPSPNPPLRLIKFGRVPGSTDKVTVEYVAEMTDAWLQDQRRMVWEAIQTVRAHIEGSGAGQVSP